MKMVELKVSQIGDAEVLQMFQELCEITRIDYRLHGDLRVGQFLTLCLHPDGGASKPMKLTAMDLDTMHPAHELVLRTKAGKTGDALHGLLRELLVRLDEHIEKSAGAAVYTILNRTLIEKNGKRKPRGRYRT